MFKSLYNLAKINYSITPETALLIKSQETLDPTLPDMSFLRMATPFGETIYIPGSSIKGVFRSTAEEILRSFQKSVCDLLEPKVEEDKKDKKRPYQKHCSACKIFGSTEMSSRVRFSDLFPWEDGSNDDKKTRIKELLKFTTLRPGVSIDRKKGNVKAGPFELEILTGGSLYGYITFTNFQLWQVGLLFKVIEMANEGLVKFGYAKSRGLGRVRIDIRKIEFLQTGALLNSSLSGVGEVEYMRNKYELVKPDVLESCKPSETDGIFSKFNPSYDEIKGGLQNRLLEYLRGDYDKEGDGNG